jgi:O-antigen/teichoic acid export membrane protein
MRDLGKMANLLTAATSLPRQCLSILTLKEFDTGTPEGRSKERYRRVALTALSSGGAKVISVITMLISVPLTLHYLGAERYGMWMTISSVVLMLGFADLGLGLGLMNSISEAHGKEDRRAAAHYVSSAFFMLTGMAVLILAAFALAYPHIPWARLLNVKTPLAAREAGPALAALVACFALNLPLGVVQRVQNGYQEGFVISLWESLGKVLGLLGVLVVIYFQGGLVWLVLAVAGAPLLAALLNSLVLFGYQRPWLVPRWNKATIFGANKIFKMGIMFCILQLAVALAYSSDNLVAAQLLGPEAVTQYSVPMSMFGILSLLSAMLLGPLWPAYGEAFVRGDKPWLKRTYFRSLKLAFFISFVPSCLLVFIGGKIIHSWVGSEIDPSFSLLLGLGTWTVVLSLGGAMSIFLNAINILKIQILFFTIMSITALIIKILLAASIGLPGIVWGTVIAYTIFCIVPYFRYINKLLSRNHT